jgi:hypothetical protein
MPAAVYYSWERAGRPVDPSQPIRDYVTRLKAQFPKAAGLFGWYADDSHYQAVPPQDHTPYSATGWPLASPQWFVFATDVMHRPDLGVDCNALFAYWLAEAKAGRTPWVKYLIWQAKLYDVRNGWQPQGNSGHFDHIHISVRTDWKDKGLGAWSLVPGEDDMTPEEHRMLATVYSYVEAEAWRVDALNQMSPTVRGGPYKGEKALEVTALLEIKAKVDALAAATGVDLDALEAAVEKAVADAIAAATPAIADAVNDDAAERLQN